MTEPNPTGGYAPVNGLSLYYEVHGTGQPLVLLHGAFSAIGSSFGELLPTLAQTRQVIAVDLQGHGHTLDIDRPMTIANMADDVAALLRELGIASADLFGYSMGSGVALQLALHYPELVRKVVVVSVGYNNEAFHPGLMDGMAQLQPEHLVGSPWHEEYLRLAPQPDDFPKLVAQVKNMNSNIPAWPAEAIRSMQAPFLLIIGDSDIIRLGHAVEMFELLGGGVSGDNAGLPNSQLAVLPGTSHSMMMARTEMLLAIIPPFLDAPMPEAK